MAGDVVRPEPTGHQATRTKGPDGRFIATLETADLDAEAARLRSRSMSYRAIAAEMGCAPDTAWERVQRALAAVRSEGGLEVLKLELAKLDRLEAYLLGVMEREHLMVQHGKVVRLESEDADGTMTLVPVLDDGPGVQAAAQLRQVSESRRKLLGADAAQKVDLSGGVRYEIVMPGQTEGEGL